MGIKLFYKQVKEQTLFIKVILAMMLIILILLAAYIAVGSIISHSLGGLL